MNVNKNKQKEEQGAPRKYVSIKDLRESLKAIIRNEVDMLPQNLAQLEAKERLNILCKMMPFVFPKVEAVEPTSGEPFGWG